ncbi:alpha/beta hydrolase [Pseudomonas sp. P9_31]|uniref:alpha/beta hydrolase n=1 Tax=Pseudomonas sp. P9_31 TaxID=3043448 RepID=UPI002A36D3E4|nr:alpha/beta hydrolase [Pseudomonas sp. P9_31]WPN59603.1 alpha/beta hydrolase [Pseudomonas sp. P9_31]
MADEGATVEAPLAKREVKTHTLTCKTDQSVKQVSVSLRNFVVFFIGGAGDQESYYLSGPNNNVDDVREIFIRDAKQLKFPKGKFESWPLGYNDFITDKDLSEHVLKKIPDCSTAVYIIGHSLGGWNGAHLSSVLTDKGYKVRMLITIDPVGEGKVVWSISNIYRLQPKPKAEYWVNIRAAAAPEKRNLSDRVADFGGQWEVVEGPDVMGRVDVNHADAHIMYIRPLNNGKTARQILNESILNYFKE